MNAYAWTVNDGRIYRVDSLMLLVALVHSEQSTEHLWLRLDVALLDGLVLRRNRPGLITAAEP